MRDTLVSTMAMHFGEHITLDGYDGDPLLLNSKELVISSINELCTLFGMHKLSEVSVLEAPDNQIRDPGGWSGFVVIAESHISIHTFPKRRFISADVYTCKNGLDATVVADFFKKKFSLQSVDTTFIIRGLRYPDQNIA